MKLRLAQSNLSNPQTFLRREGWAHIVDRARGKESFVKRLTRDFYPRIHLYVVGEGDYYILDAHLDQKQVSYAGAEHMHNAEYDHPAVREALEELKSVLSGAEFYSGRNVSSGNYVARNKSADNSQLNSNNNFVGVNNLNSQSSSSSNSVDILPINMAESDVLGRISKTVQLPQSKETKAKKNWLQRLFGG
ncbi:MAG: hypothetical protein MUF50_00875 [Planctomycetes bacterium]|jgi:hypothetical protein|nr:hypothetical protein [Planctomycetota bacterium]